MSTFDGIDRLDHLLIWDGVSAQAVEGERMTLAIIELEPDSAVPEHSHANEQLGVLIRGSMRFRAGEESRELDPGDTWRILGHVPHEVTAGPDGALAVECFTPARDDWAGLARLEARPAPRLA
jgi:quercetin dioxygenase-like cupin family protein